GPKRCQSKTSRRVDTLGHPWYPVRAVTPIYALLLALPEEGHEAAQPLIDLDGTVFIQLGLFLLMLIALRALVFRPFLRARAERDDQITGEKRRAVEMEQAAQTKLEAFSARLEQAKQTGIAMRARARTEAGQRERAVLDRARAETQALLEAERAHVAKM